MHLRFQAMGPLQLLCNEVRLLHQWHHKHQLLLQSLHRLLVVPVFLLFCRRLLRGSLELLDASRCGGFGATLLVNELLLQTRKLLCVFLLVLRRLHLVCGLCLRLLLDPLCLSLLHLCLEFLLALPEKLVRLLLRFVLCLLRLLYFPLELFGHLPARLQLLLRRATHLSLRLRQLLSRHGIAYLAGLEQVRGLPSGWHYEDEVALAEGDAIAMRQFQAVVFPL
mmetsp:Transcript_54861/g.158711  ORF Transcript_54861/g.158711 Transcript_54861/m.158711 type:complete len:223 (-) Transcript_54861:1815-2483(-)